MSKENVDFIMEQFAQLGKKQIKNIYMRHGVREPLFGVTSGSMKPLAKKHKKDTALAKALYATAIYDAMYFAGMIVDPQTMSKADFEEWMRNAYCYPVAEYIVAVTLAESPYAQALADAWIKSMNPLYISAGWSCYAALVGYAKDDTFDKEKLSLYLSDIESTIHKQNDRVRYAMNSFIISVGISYLPLHQEALETAKRIGQVIVDPKETSCKTPDAVAYIQKAILQNRLGYKRKNARC